MPAIPCGTGLAFLDICWELLKDMMSKNVQCDKQNLKKLIFARFCQSLNLVLVSYESPNPALKDCVDRFHGHFFVSQLSFKDDVNRVTEQWVKKMADLDLHY